MKRERTGETLLALCVGGMVMAVGVALGFALGFIARGRL